MNVTDTEQEYIIRKAASNVNQQLISVREKYPNVPNENYYDAMVMLNSEIRALTAENKNDKAPIFDTIDALKEEIDGLIAK